MQMFLRFLVNDGDNDSLPLVIEISNWTTVPPTSVRICPLTILRFSSHSYSLSFQGTLVVYDSSTGEFVCQQ